MSSNLQKSTGDGDDDSNANRTQGDEQPGTSRSFQDAPEGLRDSDLDISSDGGQNQSQGQSPVGNAKVRNVLRERPPLETGEKKRPRISDENDEEGEDDVHMETDSSSENDEDEEKDNPRRGTVDVADSDQPESLPVQDIAGTSHSQARRSSSNAEENVSTTMQSSSPSIRQRPSVSGDPGGSRYRMDSAIASTSAAALAPPLSRLMEDSPLLDDMYNVPARRASAERSRSSHRETTPAAASYSPSMGALYFQRKSGADVDLNENKGPDAFLDKMQGTQRLLWARKLFFLSTELVFPGFTAYSDNKNQIPDYMGCVRVRSSCMMQGLLYADVLFFIAWVLSFLSTSDILITVIKELHGYLSICLTCLFIIVNILRLRFGLKGNENDEVQYLALFWMTTVIVQIPLFMFIFLTDLFCPVLLAFTVTMDGVMMAFILLESIVGFIHFRSLLRDELNIIRMARRSKEAGPSRANLATAAPSAASFPVAGGSNSNPNVMDLGGRGLPDQDASSSEEDDREVENERFGRNSMNFEMHIRRLSESHRQGQNQEVEEEEQDSDDSNSNSSEQVTSTSDTNIRRRSIIAH